MLEIKSILEKAEEKQKFERVAVLAGDLNLVHTYFGWNSDYFTANAQTILVGEYIDSETLWKIGKAIEEFNEYRRNIEIETETEN